MRFILRDRRSIRCSWRVTLLAPRNVNDVSYVMRIHDEIHFAWQAQYLLKVEPCFWEIAGARNVVFFNIQDGTTKVQGCVPEMLNLEFGCRRSIWSSWRVTLVGPGIVNDVSK